MIMDPQGQLRNLRDFLLVYNRMTEICFQRCTSNFNYRNLTMDEERCVDNCAGKLIRTNHRLMGTYVQLMPAMVQKRMQEMESKAAEVAKAEAAVQSSSTTDTSTSSQSGLEIQDTPAVPESLQISSAPFNISDIKTSAATNASAFGESDVQTGASNTQSFTNESFEGLATPSLVNTSVHEPESSVGVEQSPHTPS
ncbi:hypothetical protein DNTS_020649 [Danionella cerebrum]|uniref:Mitochondrial import inner membrane translocase subunit Tim10 B n=1 Tax=Danionella cerebrum TaxID=2873325 RepID=A0A553PZL5_9TELE|nr:hypothetical protein DNTS_020649 [Danionella translucida]